VAARAAINPANGAAAAIVVDENDALQKCAAAGIATWHPNEYVILYLSNVARRNAGTFLTDEIVQRHLDVLEDVYPELVQMTVARFGLMHITHVARRLLEEDVSIRDLPRLLETLLTINGTTTADDASHIVFAPHVAVIPPGLGSEPVSSFTVDHYADAVRAAMKRTLTHKFATRTSGTLVVYLLDREIEQRLARAEPPLTDQERADILEAVRQEIQAITSGWLPPILTLAEVRRPVRRLLEREFPYLPVISYQELSPEANIQPLARITAGQGL
jgi:type III secretion protein V